MAEIYRNELGVIHQKLPAGASGVSAHIIRNGISNPATSLTFDFTTSTASVSLPWSYTANDGEFQVDFEFSIGIESGQHLVQTVRVVTAVISRDKAELIAPGKYEDFEPIVRYIIQAYTGQYFGLWTGVKTVWGEGDEELRLPDRLVTLSNIGWDGNEYYTDGFRIKGDRFYLARSGRTPLITKESPPDNYDAVIVAPPGTRYWYPIKRPWGFDEQVEYSITGTWGYIEVPASVQKAAELLYNDVACDESVYRNKYMKSVRSDNWRIEFNEQAWTGTGNAIADQLLDEFKQGGWAII